MGKTKKWARVLRAPDGVATKQCPKCEQNMVYHPASSSQGYKASWSHEYSFAVFMGIADICDYNEPALAGAQN